ncbi:hypothetical protein [Acanthopleuribacter pedis]|uniref:Uncharacterized protein n=1 Tax=Acanthopleuribacter pedis TaxID=442870 RepID=A0A8J7U6X4_9BACT|nr:hypothetical protein [Acanthopleuribacter pedis]MBO1322394.1 hypothetical protein [Acanthopleuribacter pedis]
MTVLMLDPGHRRGPFFWDGFLVKHGSNLGKKDEAVFRLGLNEAWLLGEKKKGGLLGFGQPIIF